ncbi:MAG TPA: hypothetical protein PK800_04890, partial [Syntrophorhabdaceae bacterium]|nr:hypothetical protein [Syntrophorhabdaceae bacterium]
MASLIIFTIITGACGIVAQTILIRELLILFSGNELSIGVIIGSWILWEAAGAYTAGKRHVKKELNINISMALTVLFSLLFPVSIYITRVFKVIAGIPLDTGAGILHIFYASFVILFPLGFLHGMLFTLICSFFGDLLEDKKDSIGMVYFYEMLGTIVGGMLLNLFFIQFFNAFTIAVYLCVISLLSCFLLSVSLKDTIKRGFTVITVMFLLLSVIALITGATKTVHNYSVNRQWSGRDVVYYKNSLYQNIVVIKDHEQFAFFTDGVYSMTIPMPDITFIEDLVHLPMLSFNGPENILVLSRGAGGIINEILKYSTVKRIDYVETDPEFLKTIGLFATNAVKKELNNDCVKLHFTDGRVFLKNSFYRYDVIFINVPLPYTLQTNRFFTREFFGSVKKALKPNGVGILTLPASMAYYPVELKNLHACILKTVKSIFPYVFTIPGEYNIFVFSGARDSINFYPQNMFKTLKERQIKTRLMNVTYLEDRLDKKKIDWYLTNLNDVETDINTDFLPSGFFYALSYNNLLYSPYLKPFFELIKRINFKKILLGILMLTFLSFVISIQYRGMPILYSIGTTGLSSIILELILIFAFQIYFGYVFYEVGILITVFLGGIASGGIIAIAPVMKRVKDVDIFC